MDWLMANDWPLRPAVNRTYVQIFSAEAFARHNLLRIINSGLSILAPRVGPRYRGKNDKTVSEDKTRFEILSGARMTAG